MENFCAILWLNTSILTGEKMVEKVTISLLSRDEYLRNPIEIGLDDDWTKKSRSFDRRVKFQGVYMLHVPTPFRIVYVGKTRGPSMDFHTRLYRHATEAASSNSKVYRALKKVKNETRGPLLVSLIRTEQIRSLFEGKQLEDRAMIDIYEQTLIHLLKPEIQE